MIAKEKRSGLSLVARIVVSTPQEYSDLYTKPGDPCLAAWCLDRRAADLISRVGVIDTGVRRTNGTPGFLLAGPYISLDAGEYLATIEADVDIADDAYFDVVLGSGTDGAASLSKVQVSDAIGKDGKSNVLRFHFKSDQAVQQLQLRLFVTERSDIKVYGYTITKNAR